MSIIKQLKGVTASKASEIVNQAGRGLVDVSYGAEGLSVSENFNKILKNKAETTARSPLKELYKNGKHDETLFFPSDLSADHYIMFKVVSRVRPSRNQNLQTTTLKTIALPVPMNLMVGYGVNYSDAELGIFGGLAAGRIGDSDITNAVSSGVEGVRNLIGKLTKSIADAQSINDLAAEIALSLPAAGALGIGAVNKLAGIVAIGGGSTAIAKGFSYGTGIAINPHMAQVFEGVGFRTHEFGYDFVARNQQESDTIKKIIKSFKYHMYPNYFNGTNLAFNYPEEFEIEFSNPLKENLFKLGRSVLKGFEVTYNGQGMPLFFEDTNEPVHVKIKLNFAEVEVLHKDHPDVRLGG